MLKLYRAASHEWEFVYPKIYDQLMDEFNKGCESFEEGNLVETERIFKSVLTQMPDHLDAIHHLAMVQSEQGLVKQARDLWEQSVRIGRKAFPPEFELGHDHLEWGWLDNRPFLRCLHGLALAKYKDGKVHDALQLFQELLSLNPNDNQGVRAMAAEAFFELGKFEKIIEITSHYRDDIMSETLYGRAIALFKLCRRKEATAALNKAIKYLPLVSRELLKKRHSLPKAARPDRVTVGGADEAYYYWEHWGRFWEEDPEVFEWLRRIQGATKPRKHDQ
jgi:tetratricopeptide (TPR) repeat protein